MDPSASLARRGLTSAGWKLGASLGSAGVLLLRAVILARLLEISSFGVYAFAFAVVRLTSVMAEFGLGDAFLHRAAETADEEQAAAVHFGLSCLFTLLWSATLIAAALIAADPPLRTALVVLTASTAALQLARTPTLVLVRRVRHQRLAAIDLLSSLATTLVAVWLAVLGAGLWALLATDVVAAAVAILALQVWRPVRRIRAAWTPALLRYYLRFGSRSLAAGALSQTLASVPNLWTGLFLGNAALGFYSRAHVFATYPRRIVARPILAVVAGIYAELKGDPDRLAAAFATVNALLLRVGLGIAGPLALAAPELVSLVLGERWLPMVPPFRVLLVFALIAPIEVSLAQLFVAVGRPGRPVWARLLQLCLLCIGLATMGPLWGGAGVALAATAALLLPVCLLVRWSREHVHFSLTTLLMPPLSALAAAACAAAMARALAAPSHSELLDVGLIAATFLPVYAGVLALLERRYLANAFGSLGEMLRGTHADPAQRGTQVAKADGSSR